jgi:TRAP-type mannitol/chloroaromatic compound transport system permease small subunit
MVFPAISVGKNLSFAWNLTNRRERVWLTITSTAIFMTPIYIVLIFLIFSLQPSSYLIWASIFISLIFINSHYSQLFKSFTVRKDK